MFIGVGGIPHDIRELRFDVCVCCGIVLVVKYANDDVRCSWALIDFD